MPYQYVRESLTAARYDHINPYGHYQFQVDRWAGKKPLRPIKV